MTMRLIKYKMHRNNEGNLITPTFIEDGGYYGDVPNNELIGLVSDSAEHFVPQTDKDTPAGVLAELTRAELITRMQGIGMKDADNNDMTDPEIATFIGDWCDVKGVA